MHTNPLSPFPQRAQEFATAYVEAIIVHPHIMLPKTALAQNPFIYAALLFIGIISVGHLLQIHKRSPLTRSQTPSPNPGKPGLQTASSRSRPPGVWIPVEFPRPAASPYPNWDIHTTEPLPYRPFKFGPGHITMGLRAMKWDEWIELDNQYLEWQAIKAQRIEERGEKCCKTAPEAYDGAIELLEEL